MSVSIYFNPLDTACKNILGAVSSGETLQFNVFSLKEDQNDQIFSKLKEGEFHVETPALEDCVAPCEDAYLHINRDGENKQTLLMEKTQYGWTITVNISEIGLYFYSFYVENIGVVSCNDREMGELSQHTQPFLLTVYSPEYTTPEWFKGGVMYQIFPDRFCKIGPMPDIKGRVKRKDWGGLPSYRPNEKGKVLNNDFFGGNFKGIQSKLGYLTELGVTVIYLNPIFEAASNHRYDTSNYMKIDPILGTEQDFKEFVNAAKDQGIRVILDGVFNHTGDDSVYFNKYGNYPSVGAYQSKDSPYYSWYSFQEFPDRYSSWWGIDILPEINETSEDYQNFIFGKDGVLKHWLACGIGGYRLDVADELPDFFLKGLRKSVKETDPNAIIIGEVWEDASNKIAYSKRREYLHGYELDSVMNYPLKDGIIHYIYSEKAVDLLKTVRALVNHYPKQTVDCLMNILGTHDTARILTVLGGIYCQNKDEMASDRAYLNEIEKNKAIQRLKMAAVLQYTMPGVPCVYYGDENAMEGHIDPFCRCCFDWNNINKDLLDFYKTLGKLRSEYKEIFKDGGFQEIIVKDGFFVFKREQNNKSVYIYTNNCSKPQLLNLNGVYQEYLTKEIFRNRLPIKPYSFGILINKGEQL